MYSTYVAFDRTGAAHPISGNGFACTRDELPRELAWSCERTHGFWPVSFIALPLVHRPLTGPQLALIYNDTPEDQTTPVPPAKHFRRTSNA